MNNFLVFCVLFNLSILSAYVKCSENKATLAEVQSCSGCQLSSLPEVKAFIFEDVPKYNNVVFKSISGAPPELVLFSDNYQEIERIPLRGRSRAECNTLLQKKGFSLKENTKEL